MNEEELLAAVRRAHEPSVQDAARVLQATRSAIATAAAGDGGSLVAGAGGSGGALAIKLLAGALVIAGVSGGLGYRLGLDEGRARQASAAAVPPDAVAAPAPVAMGPVATAPSAPAAPAMQPAVDARPPARAEPEMARARAARPRGPHLEPPVAAPAEPAGEPSLPLGSIEAEVRALERVQRALRDRAPAEALALLQQLDRDVPQGRLTEERSAARALARCELGQGEPLAHALEFSQRFPASVYFARVRKTCMDAAQKK